MVPFSTSSEILSSGPFLTLDCSWEDEASADCTVPAAMTGIALKAAVPMTALIARAAICLFTLMFLPPVIILFRERLFLQIFSSAAANIHFNS